jgi:hypothetical protein
VEYEEDATLLNSPAYKDTLTQVIKNAIADLKANDEKVNLTLVELHVSYTLS